MVRANSIEETDSPLRASQQIDFNNIGVVNESGQLCVTQEDQIETVETEPELECEHSEREECTLTYITFYQPGLEEVCKGGSSAVIQSPDMRNRFERIMNNDSRAAGTRRTLRRVVRSPSRRRPGRRR